jgi:hypothetical protein
MTHVARFLLLMLPLAACHMNNEALRVELISAIEPDTQCAYTPTNARYSHGIYDPTVNQAQGYELAFVLRNNMQSASEALVSDGPLANVNRRSHDVQLLSFEGCWYLPSAIAEGDFDGREGEQVACKTLPLQSGTLVTSGRIDEGEGTNVATVQVLDLAALRSVFGPSFSPMDIPPKGLFVWPDPTLNPQVAGLPQTTPVTYAYRFGPQSTSGSVDRSAAWGENFPMQSAATVVVQLRANLQMQSGEAMATNWISIPITVSPGSQQDFCGPLVQKVCARGPCADGTPCLNTGLCGDTSLLCSPITLLSGTRPDFDGINAIQPPCLPAQKFPTALAVTCLPVGCDVTQ